MLLFKSLKCQNLFSCVKTLKVLIMCSIEFIQINDMCRACLKTDPEHLQSLFCNENATIFTSCTSIEVSKDDGLPENVCFDCYETLNNTFKFQQLCVTSNATLKESILNIQYQALDQSIEETTNNENASNGNISRLFHSDISHDDSDLPIICKDVDSTFNYSSDDNANNLEEDVDEVTEKCITDDSSLKEKILNTTDIKTSKRKNKIRIKCLVCTICQKALKSVDRMEAHIRMHEGKKPEVCKQCGKDFSNIRSLRRHMLKHNDVKKYHCSICDKQFTYSTSLSQHMRIHANIRQYVCDVCGKSFVQGNGLTSHLLTHSSDTPFPCEICGKRFKSQNFLKNHVLRHASFKNFVCSLCGKLFATKSELTTHVRSHTGEKPFICSHCKKCFKTRSHLNEHKKSHMADRPFVCDICPRSFAYSKVLRNHRMTHTGEKPHECFICQKAFTQKGALTVHMRTHKGLNNFS